MKLKTNAEKLAKQAVLGEVSAPVSHTSRRWRVSPDGEPNILPGVGGITYNCKVGHNALEWATDHMEPGVSVKNNDKSANAGLNLLACVGNTATVVSGDAKGDCGIVTGKHGGIEHVLMDFPDSTLEKLIIGDKIQVRACGLGLKLMDFPQVKLSNLDPGLLDEMDLVANGQQLRVPVARTIPAEIMGAGIGPGDVYTGDYDIQLSDEKVVDEHDLKELRMGDIVAITDADHSYGRIYRTGAVSVGVVVHSRCTQSGHGPGVTTLMTSAEGAIEPVLDETANLAHLLGIGTQRAGEE